MNPIGIDELSQKFGSRYSLVIATAKRARQLKEGAPPLVETTSRNPISIALEEIMAGKVLLGKAPEEAVSDQAPRVQDYLSRRGSLQDQIVAYALGTDDDDEDDEDEDDKDELEGFGVEEEEEEKELDFEDGEGDLHFPLGEEEEEEDDEDLLPPDEDDEPEEDAEEDDDEE